MKSNLFDPFYFEDESEEIDDNMSDDGGGDANDNNFFDNNEEPNEQDHKIIKNEAEDEFKIYISKHLIDPFLPWPTILSVHGTSPQFMAIPSDKRRQEIFSQLCPLLIEAKRAEKASKIEEARNWWNEFIIEPVANRMTWFLLLKRIKDSQKYSKLFSLLNERDCEKEYKNLLLSKKK